MIVTRTLKKHALYTLKVGGQKVIFDPHLKRWGSIDPLDPVLPRSMNARMNYICQTEIIVTNMTVTGTVFLPHEYKQTTYS